MSLKKNGITKLQLEVNFKITFTAGAWDELLYDIFQLQLVLSFCSVNVFVKVGEY